MKLYTYQYNRQTKMFDVEKRLNDTKQTKQIGQCATKSDTIAYIRHLKRRFNLC